MNKQQIVLSILGVALVLLLFQLPKVVVDNEEVVEAEHDMTIDEEALNRMKSLREQIETNKNSKISISFADSLAKEFLHYQMIDSAAQYAEYILNTDSSAEAKEKAALIYYRSSRIGSVGGNQREYVESARSLLSVLVENEPDNNSLKNKLAMTLMASETPMQGVMMLREIVENDPQNREAILNLGVLAVQSGQYDRAIERFENLLELDSTDYEASFYKAVSLVESGRSEEGKKFFEEVLNSEDADAATKAMASNYLKEL